MRPERAGQVLDISALKVVAEREQQYDRYWQVLHQLLTPLLLYPRCRHLSLDQLVTLLAF